MQSLPLTLGPGSDLHQSLHALAQERQITGFVVGVVGNLTRAAFQCPGRPEPTVLEGDLEVITLNGTLSPQGVHLHLSLSDGACQVWGGHLEPGTLVQKGVDLLIAVLDQPAPSPAVADAVKSAAPRVEIAVLPGCPWCTRALRLLRSLEIAHTVVTVDSDETFHAVQSRSGLTTFPQVFVDGGLLGGYDALAKAHAEGGLNHLR